MKRLVVAIMLCVGLLIACTPQGQTVKVGSIEIISPWIMAADSGGNTAGFMLIKNTGSEADRLVKVEFAQAMEADIHETKMQDDRMEMMPIDALEIPANGQVELKSGGYHVMIMGLKQELKSGDKVDVTFTFEKAGSVTASIEVRNP